MHENDWMPSLLRPGRLSGLAIFVLVVLVTLELPLCNTAAAAPQPAAELTPGELVEAATSGESYPRQPRLSTEMQGLAANEIKGPKGAARIRTAWEQLAAANRREGGAPEAVKIFEQEQAVWSLLACLTSPREDVQIQALRSLKWLGDQRTVRFLLVYAEYMAVHEHGSENATIHGTIHETVARTLSALTGVEFELNGQGVGVGDEDRRHGLIRSLTKNYPVEKVRQYADELRRWATSNYGKSHGGPQILEFLENEQPEK